ncbi:MAG: hypothetical protein NTY03_06050 [Candidatus Bathyarchaeota archaeon]|nr:hypothetical protein [Candidatus Bathyarchaeota archaeon]
MREYVRVTKPGGYVGLSESTWLKSPPPPEIVAWAAQDLGTHVNLLDLDGSVRLLEGAGLGDIVAKTYEANVREEAKALVSRYGFAGILHSLWRALVMYVSNPAYSRSVKGVRKSGITPDDLMDYLGYGIYVGRKRYESYLQNG